MHPIHLLDGDDLTMLRLWSIWTATSGAVLPFAGGAADQAACVMRGFEIMAAAAAALPKADP